MSVPTLPEQMSDLCSQTGTVASQLNTGSNASHLETGNDASKIAVTVLTSLLSFVIIVGNGLIIMSVAIVKKLRQPANYLIVSLALSDFLVGFIVLPLTTIYDSLGEWIFGSMMCDIHVSFDVICCTASIMNLCIISIDRYLMITKPMTYPKKRTPQFMLVLISAAWLMSCIIIIPALFGFTENVKDSASWIDPKIVASGTDIKTDNKVIGKFSSNDAHADNLTDASNQRYWSQAFELDDDYNIMSFRYSNPIGEEVLQFHLQVELCGEDDKRITESIFFVRPENWGNEVNLTGNTAGKFMTLTLNSTSRENSSEFENFQLFAEKLHGKSCLISQEVWFTIYSTVGAFYLPLAIMLIMYWKIYREASKFRPPRNCHSFNSDSQENNNQFVPPVKSQSIEKCYNSSPNLVSDRSRINNNPANTKVSITNGSALTELTDSKANMVIKNFQLLDDQKRLLRLDVCPPIDDVMIDDGMTCEVCEGKETDLGCDAGNLVNSVNGQNLAFLDGLKETIIADTEDTKNDNLLNRKYSAPPSLLSPCDDCKSVRPGASTWPSGDTRTRFRLHSTNSMFSAKTPGCRGTDSVFPPICENNVLELPDEQSKPSKPSKLSLSVSDDFHPDSNGFGNDNTRKLISSYDRNKPRHSIFSATSICACRPLIDRNGSNHRRKYSKGNNCSSNQHYTTKKIRKTSSFSRGTVLKNIKRHVSSATSRERMRNVKATRTLGIIVGVFTFCWLPFFIVTFIRPFICEKPESQDCIPLLLIRIVLWLGYVNSALNPLIYIGFSCDLRKSFRYLLTCKCTNVDRRLAQDELRSVISREKKSTSHHVATESIM